MQAQSQYTIVQSTKDQLINYYNIQQSLGWDPFNKCQQLIEATGIEGCFFGKINGDIVSSISVMKYRKYGFVGVYWVKQEYRGKGYGLQIFNKGIQFLSDCEIIGLDAVAAQISNYQKSGFQIDCNSIRASAIGPKQGQELSKKDTSITTNQNDIQLQKIVSFDSKHFPSSRSSFLKKAIELGQIIVSQHPDTKEIIGYGIVNKLKSGICLGPLIAQTSQAAQDIIKTMFQKHQCQRYDLFYCDNHKHIQSVVKKWFPLIMYSCKRMYKRNKDNVDIDNKCVYGLSGYERG